MTTWWLLLIALMVGASCSPSTHSCRRTVMTSRFRRAQALASLSTTGNLSVVAGPSGQRFEISVSSDPEGWSSFPEDNFLLRIRTPGAPEPLVLDFVSTYGSFDLSLFDLTNDQVPDIILVTGGGRGTSVRSEVLRVFDCSSGKLEMILEEAVSGYFGSGAHWGYERSIWSHVSGGNPILRFILSHDEPRPSALEDAALIPADAVLDYAYDRQGRLMKQVGSVRRK